MANFISHDNWGLYRLSENKNGSSWGSYGPIGASIGPNGASNGPSGDPDGPSGDPNGPSGAPNGPSGAPNGEKIGGGSLLRASRVRFQLILGSFGSYKQP